MFHNKQSYYARYGVHYIQLLKNMNASHLEALEEFENISVRRNNTGIGQAIDLAGEQTYMKSVKTTGKYFPKEVIVKYLIWFHLVTWSPKFT